MFIKVLDGRRFKKLVLLVRLEQDYPYSGPNGTISSSLVKGKY